MLIGLALFAVLTAITLPMVVSQTRKLTWDEVLAQVERQAAVVRGDAQRRSEPVWLEARWLESEKAWALGTRTMRVDEGEAEVEPGELSGLLIGEMESFMTEDMAERPPMDEVEPETMSGFEVVMLLPTGFEVLIELPDELAAMREQGAAIEPEDAALEPMALLENEGVPFETEDPDLLGENRDRALVAVFLPDGTLIAPERLYVRSPQGRLATITSSRWLGSVRCETLTMGELMTTGIEEPFPEDEPETEPLEPEPIPEPEEGS